MTRIETTFISVALLIFSYTAASASVTVCTHSDWLGRTYTVNGDHGVYTWVDHGIERSWALTCNEQKDGSNTCHRWEQYGEKGRSAMIFRMMPDGTLIEASSMALLDVSSMRIIPGFECTTSAE